MSGHGRYPMQMRDFGSCKKCGVKKGTACRTPSCAQLQIITFDPILGTPPITRGPSIPADMRIEDVPMFMTHKVVEINDGWFLGHPNIKESKSGQSANLTKLVIGNRHSGDMFFVDLKPLNLADIKAAMLKKEPIPLEAALASLGLR